MLGLQGGVREHLELLDQIGVETVRVRRVADFVGPDGLRLDGLVLPGGESSTLDRLLRRFEIFEPLQQAIRDGLPTFGTCAGLILLAHEVVDPAPGQQSLQVLDVSVQRNAFGAQLASCEATLDTQLGRVEAAFIRAPVVTRVGADVEVLATYQGRTVGVRSGRILGISFHPELTGDETFHRYFVDTVAVS